MSPSRSNEPSGDRDQAKVLYETAAAPQWRMTEYPDVILSLSSFLDNTNTQSHRCYNRYITLEEKLDLIH